MRAFPNYANRTDTKLPSEVEEIKLRGYQKEYTDPQLTVELFLEVLSYDIWNINVINSLIRVAELANNQSIFSNSSVDKNEVLLVKVLNNPDHSLVKPNKKSPLTKEIIPFGEPLPDLKLPQVYNPLQDPNVEIIYGHSSKLDANFRVQADNPNESSNAPITLDKKILSNNQKTAEINISKNKQVDNYDPAIHNLDGTLRSRPIPTHKWEI
ncbi:MAG: hypothetical protein F6K17_25390 [Okeania sp. SIO3C4]|nr:hypothetical protein [Okeania sp. SIO3C4]